MYGNGGLNLLSGLALKKLNIVPTFDRQAVMGNINLKLSKAALNLMNLYKNCDGIMPNAWLPLLFTLCIWILIVYSCVKRRMLLKLPFLAIVYLGNHLLRGYSLHLKPD